MLNKKQQRLRRARQTRIRIATQQIHRLSVHRTNFHTYASLISEDGLVVLATASSLDQATKSALAGAVSYGNVATAEVVGRVIAEKAKALGITRVAFDRSGFAYHGRVKALADAARAAGLEF